jgi:hypothetical protein
MFNIYLICIDNVIPSSTVNGFPSKILQSDIRCLSRKTWNHLLTKSHISGFSRIASVNLTEGIMKGIRGFTGAESSYLSAGYKVTETRNLVWDYLFTKALMFLSHAFHCSSLASLHTSGLLRIYVTRLQKGNSYCVAPLCFAFKHSMLTFNNTFDERLNKIKCKVSIYFLCSCLPTGAWNSTKRNAM